VRYYFDWNPQKAKANLKKHKVSFEQAASIFLDQRAVTIFDKGHSEREERWVTMGIDKNGILLVMVHTFQQIEEDAIKIRVISARKAARKEIKQYKEGNK